VMRDQCDSFMDARRVAAKKCREKKNAVISDIQTQYTVMLQQVNDD